MAYNEHWSSVGLALRFTGSNGSTAITCDKGRGITLHGEDISISTAWYDVAPSTGNYSAATWETEGSALEVAYHADYADWGTGAGTVAFTFRTPGELAGYSPYLFRLVSPDSADGRIRFGLSNGRLFYDAGPWWDDNYYEGPELATNTTYRVMLTRNASNTWKLMVNGSVVLTHVQSEPYAIGGSSYQAWLFANPNFELGAFTHATSGGGALSMDEVFVVKGVALETGAYTPAPMFEDYAGGGDPPGDVTCDMLGAIELSGEMLAGQPFLAAMAGAIELSGELSVTQPPFAVISGPIKFAGDLQAGQPVFAQMGGGLPLSGALLANAGPVAALGGSIVLGGSLLAGRGVAGSCAGQINLSGGAQVRHGRAGDIAGTLALGGALSALHRQAFTADCLGEITLSGLLSGDYLLYPPGEQHDVVTVFRREQRITVNG